MTLNTGSTVCLRNAYSARPAVCVMRWTGVGGQGRRFGEAGAGRRVMFFPLDRHQRLDAADGVGIGIGIGIGGTAVATRR